MRAMRSTPFAATTAARFVVPMLAAFAVGGLTGPSTVRAEVVSSAANGFEVRAQVELNATPEVVYKALVEKVGSWWDPAHTWSQDASNLSIDARPGGCFCERLPDGGGVAHMTVVYASPGKLLRMTGALGPLQAMGLGGALSWEFKDSGTGTTLVQTYRVGGYSPSPLTELAPIVDSVMLGQLQRLERFVETGRPEIR